MSHARNTAALIVAVGVLGTPLMTEPAAGAITASASTTLSLTSTVAVDTSGGTPRPATLKFVAAVQQEIVLQVKPFIVSPP